MSVIPVKWKSDAGELGVKNQQRLIVRLVSKKVNKQISKSIELYKKNSTPKLLNEENRR